LPTYKPVFASLRPALFRMMGGFVSSAV